METWFLNHVLGLSLSVLLLGLPGPLGAGTPNYNRTKPVTEGFYDWAVTDELSTRENGETSTFQSSESPSPSHRDVPLPHTAAGNFETERALSLSTEPLISSPVTTTETSSSMSSIRNWKDFTNTDQTSDISHPVSSEAWIFTDDTSMPQDSMDPTLRLGDVMSSQTDVLRDTSYTTTISRAGERALLSVTSSSSNSTSSTFTEESKHLPSTRGVPPRPVETEDYTHRAPSTRTHGGDTTNQHMTDSTKRMFFETGSPAGSRGTQNLTGQPNTTQDQHMSTSEGTSDSTPPLSVTEPSSDQSDVSLFSTPPFTSPAGAPDVSGTDRGSGPSTESSTNQGRTDGVSTKMGEEGVGSGLTVAPSTVSRSTSDMDETQTNVPGRITEVFLTTTPITVTERITEEDTFKATTFTPTTVTTLPLPASSSRLTTTTTTTSPPTASPTEATIPYTEPSTTTAIPTLQTSAALPTPHVLPGQTHAPSTGLATPTTADVSHTETSTRITTPHRKYITTTYTHSTPTQSAMTVNTELVVPTVVTDAPPTKIPPPQRNPCVSNPCMNGGMCVSYEGRQFTCHCQQAWTGPTCSQDMDECEQDPCPIGSRCVNTRGSFSCECPLGFDLEDGRTCTRAKTFLGTFSVNRPPHDPAFFKSATMHEIQREIIQLLNASLSVLRGYSRSTLSKKEEDGIRILAVNMFSISTDVTTAEVYNSIQMSLSNCSSSLAHCRMVLHHQLTYHVESLCVAQKTQCDTERSTCMDSSGTAYCQCLQGYYKHNPDDLSCLECGDGYKLENGTCVPCMFGFGGFNCGNFYKLIAVVVSPAGGGLLLILIIALIVTCCKKDKNDINKIIFKSGDLQMSPYADFPKNNRISMEWGRETIEMQENGSTKNLLQMTDIYYSPALRNSDLDRNGLYPFTGLPGSRHSCIYPAQWNPSFISDDSRRRDYF